MKATFTPLSKTLNIDEIEGKYSAFAKAPYSIAVRLSKEIAADGFGTATVNGTPVPKPVPFFMDSPLLKFHCILVSVGAVAKEYDTEYCLTLSGFRAVDGTAFQDKTFRFRTMKRGEKNPSYAAHDEIALDAAREGMVLLKNENGVLPLAPDSVLNIFGAAQYCFRNTSTGASLINPRWQRNFHQGIAEHSMFQVNEKVSKLYWRLADVIPPDDILKQAKEKNDTAIVVISRTSGEFLDNKPVPGGYYLTEDERAMIRKVATAFPKTVAIINTGYPIEMGWIEEFEIDAVIYTGFAGQAAGYALVELLDGRANPSGKLPDTWAVDYYDYPSSHNFINFQPNDTAPGEKAKGVLLYYEEDIYVGYRYFDSFGKKTAYSFGHGLSYTVFQIKWSFDEKSRKAFAMVTNTGNCPGKEVIQLYAHAPAGKIEKANRVLIAFEKTKLLAPGESQALEFPIYDMNMASFSEKLGAYVMEAGRYVFFGGNSLASSKEVGSFTLPEDQILRKTRRINLPVQDFHRMTRTAPDLREQSRMVPIEERIPTPGKRTEYSPTGLPGYSGKKITFSMLKANHNLLYQFVAQMTDAELCRLNVCGGANWYLPWQDGCAGKTVPLRKYGLPSVKVSDGNTGVNIKSPNIGLPSSTVIAATFNKELAYKVGKVIGEESKENGISINLGPGMNIHRNILNGRHPEYFSEDPMLAGTMAGHHGRGLVSAGTGCTYKHLFCNNSDTSRKGSHSIVSEQALREIYYRVFEYAMAIQMPTCMMTSYNCVNGLYPAENEQILQELLRKEWRFDGPIMTDWGTYDTVDPVEMVKAGNCWLTEGDFRYAKVLNKAVKEGKLSRAVLENNVMYWIRLILKMA